MNILEYNRKSVSYFEETLTVRKTANVIVITSCNWRKKEEKKTSNRLVSSS